MSSGRVMLGILTGVAVGAVMGILLAPDKGSKTRKKLYKKGDDYMEGIKDRFNGFIVSLSDKMDEMEEQADDLLDKGKSSVNELKKEAKNVTS